MLILGLGLTFFNFRCHVNSKPCYYLLLMNETANPSGQVQINTAWNILVCDLEKACGYELTAFPKGEKPPDFVPPIACKPPGQATTTIAPGKFNVACFFGIQYCRISEVAF